VLFALLITLSIWAATQPAAGWRLLAGVACIVGAWNSVRTLIFQRGTHSVRQFIWGADGRWKVRVPSGWVAVDISSRTAALGPWILLAWTGAGRRYYALIDAEYVSRATFRALRGRLNLALSRADPK
jgi:hypothetical protein